MNPTQQQIAVGHGQRPAAPIAGRSRIGAGRFRSYPQPTAVEAADRAAAGRHSVDMQHRRPQPYSGHQGFEGAFVLAGVVGDIGGSAAHIEGDDPLETGPGGGARRADDAAGRAGQDAVLAAKMVSVGQTAVGLHEQ